MDNPSDFRFPRVRELLDSLGVRLSKQKSQHFLHNHAVCTQIASLCNLTPDHMAVEIGAGLGNLSVELAKRAGGVLSVEMDPVFSVWHNSLTANFPNLRFCYEDFLKLDLAMAVSHSAGTPKVAVGNLPYQITAPILFKLISTDVAWERIVVMVQREVADRIVAGPTNRQASALTYKLALLFDSRIAIRLPPREFLPPPKVHSAVVVLTPLTASLVRDREHQHRLFSLITGLFQYRRRTLANCLLLSGIAKDGNMALGWLASADLDAKRRPETLTLEEIVRLEGAVHP